jgi:hypothetical protein
MHVSPDSFSMCDTEAGHESRGGVGGGVGWQILIYGFFGVSGEETHMFKPHSGSKHPARPYKVQM